MVVEEVVVEKVVMDLQTFHMAARLLATRRQEEGHDFEVNLFTCHQTISSETHGSGRQPSVMSQKDVPSLSLVRFKGHTSKQVSVTNLRLCPHCNEEEGRRVSFRRRKL